MSDTPIYDRIKMEFREPGQPLADDAAAADEAAMGDPDTEYDKIVDKELGDVD